MGNDTKKKFTITTGENDLELFKKKFNSDMAAKTGVKPEGIEGITGGSNYALDALKSVNGMPSKAEEYETRVNYVPVSMPKRNYMAQGIESDPERVKELQRALGVTVDGSYGPETRAAVMRFQRDNGLKVDGIAGPQTLGELFKYKTGMEDKYATYADTSTAKRDTTSSAVIPSTGMESKQSTYDVGDMPEAIRPGSKAVANERARGKAVPVAGDGKKYTIEDNQPSWGQVVGSSLGTGLAQTNVSILNIPRKVIEGVSLGLDAVLPDFIYSHEEAQKNDPIKKALDNAVKSNEERVVQFQKNLEGVKGLKNFVATGLTSVPQIVLAAVGGAAISGGTALSSLPEAARQLISFGVLAGSGYAREAENEGADFGQQIAYGLLGGTAESATEVIPLKNALNILKKFGAGDIAEKGAKTLIGKYGKTALKIVGNLISEGAQEGIMSPLSRGAQKMTYKPDMAMTGKEGVFDLGSIGQDAYGGIAMSVILGALGLPSAYASHRLVSQKIESGEPITPDFIQNEAIPALQNDVNSIEGNGEQDINLQQPTAQGLGNKKPISEIVNGNPVSSVNFDDLESTGMPKELIYALRQIKLGTPIPNDTIAKYPELQRIISGEISVDDYINMLDGRQLATPAQNTLDLQGGQFDNKVEQTIGGGINVPLNSSEQATAEEKPYNPELSAIDIEMIEKGDPRFDYMRPYARMTNEELRELAKAKFPEKDLTNYKTFDDFVELLSEWEPSTLPMEPVETEIGRASQEALRRRNAGEENPMVEIDLSKLEFKKVLYKGKPYIVLVTEKSRNKGRYDRSLIVPEGEKAFATGEKFVDANGKEFEYVSAKELKPFKNAIHNNAIGRETTVVTTDGDDITVQYAVVSADDLITSHDTNLNANKNYPAELQPRQRERQSSVVQINNIMNNLKPELLGENPLASDGAPIVGNDMVVESGNGRTIALKKMYETNNKNKQAYIDWLESNKANFGITGKLPNNPVLVRIRKTEVDRVAFVKKANESSVAALSYSEQARADAEKMTDETVLKFVQNDEGAINTAGNQDFIASFVKDSVPQSEIPRVLTKDGMLSQEGLIRIKNALFYKAYNDISLIDIFSESLDNSIKNITNFMLNISPKIIYIKSQIKAGNLYDIDFSNDIAEAAKKFKSLRDKGQSVENYLSQLSMFGDESPVVAEILNIFDKNNRSVKKLTTIFNYALDAVINEGNPNQISLIEKEVATKSDILGYAIRRFNNEQSGQVEGQLTIFDSERENGTEDNGTRTENSKREGSSAEKRKRNERNNPSQKIANRVKETLGKNETIKINDLIKWAEEAYGSKLSEGKYDRKQVHDAMELGVNQFLLENREVFNTNNKDIDTILSNIDTLRDIVDLLPTQTNQTEEMRDYQQFSTPPHIAYVASFAANIDENDTMLEPSAGIGGIATFAKINGAKVVVNELSQKRLEILENMGFDEVYNENAEHINSILHDKVKPTVVVMNPPFSATAGRMGDKNSTKYAKAHIEQALEILQDGGRLVAIVGQGMADDSKTFADWWKKIKAEYNVRANIGLYDEGQTGKIKHTDEYKKYGTTFGIQLITIDKTGPTANTLVTNEPDLKKVVELLVKEGIYNGRQKKNIVGDQESESASGKRDSRTKTGAAGGNNRGQSTPYGAVDELGTGQSGSGETGRIRSEGLRNDSGSGERNDGIEPKPQKGNEVANNTNGVRTGSDRSKGTEREKDSKGSSGVSPGTDDKQTERERDNIRRSGGNEIRQLKVEAGGSKSKETVKKELDDSIYDTYTPSKLKIKGAKEHPGELSESAAMAAVESPEPTYSPVLPNEIVESGALSLPQLESVVYAGQAHEQMLPDGTKRGFFLGDGTGVGKGRQISGIILDNMLRGRKKAVWISVNEKLFADAKRDWTSLGNKADDVFYLGKIKLGQKIARNQGILFTPYDTLATNMTVSGNGELTSKGNKSSRLDQIVDWLGKDFDGVIVFDEAHKMANSTTTKGKRGNKKPSARALAGVELQRRLPNARVVYVSATGATEVANLAYADRLGLWGRGTDFADKNDFINKISEGGLAAMELIARDMKAMGIYLARSLSYKGIEYETLEHQLTDEQIEIYDTMAEAWQIVLQNIDRALKATGAVDEKTGKTLDSNAKKNAMGAFWGAQQRFFNQILTSMQMPSVIEAVKKDIAEGKAVVMQLVNTNEATQNRQIAKLQDEDAPLEDLDLTPREILLQYLDKSFPTEQYETYIDENGNEKSRPVYDSKGNPVINPAAERMKQELIEKVGSLKVPEGPLEYILNTFGVENVAEITGRTKRVVTINGKAKIEKRSDRHVEADADAFMDDRKQILVFSDAGGTGKSYHADKTRKNQRRRVHYLIQAGWRADNAVQGFGRTHRTNQASAPIYRLVTTNLKGQKRFISSIARRLDQLGALTKGQRQTGSQGLFKASDNLEGTLAGDALRLFYRDLAANRIDKLDKNETFKKMGLESILDEYGKINESSSDLRDVPKFLNRILSLNTSMQNIVFDAFAERLEAVTEAAMRNGTLDTGLENYKADKVVVLDEKVVFEDEKTKAQTKYYELEAYHKNHPAPFKKYNKPDNPQFVGFYKNTRSGNVRAVYKAGNITTETGSVDDAYRLYGQINDSKVSVREFEKGNWVKIDAVEAENLWDEAVAKVPEYKTEKLYMISGTILPIWGRLPKENVKVIRTATDKGILLGRIIHPNKIDETLRNLNTKRKKGEINLSELVTQILEDGFRARLVNGWTIERRRVSGEWRMELIGRDLYAAAKQLKEDGVYTEVIQYTTRHFIPTGEDAVDVISRITEYRPIAEVIAPEYSGVQSSAMVGQAVQLPKGDGSSRLEDAKTVDEIVEIIENKIGVPIRTGKFRQKAYGIFKQVPVVIRVKVTNDLPTICHEVGHYLDKVFGLDNKQYKEELMKLGKPTSLKSYSDKEVRAEGIAEFVRLYLTDPKQAGIQAPNFLQHFESAVDKETLILLNSIRTDILKVVNLSDVNKVKNDISVGESRKATKQKTGFLGMLQKAYDAWIDEYAPFARVAKRAEKAGYNGEALNVAVKTYRGFEAKVLGNITMAQTDLNGKVIGKSFNEILEPIKKNEVDDFRAYMVARRAIDYETRNMVMPQAYATYHNTVAALEAKHPHFGGVFTELRNWEDNELQLLVDSGVMSKATVEEIKKNNPNHVPLYRIQEAVEAVYGGVGSTLGQSKKVIKKAKGSGKTIIDPLESMILNAFIIRRAAESNQILSMLADMADSIDGFGELVEAVPPGVKGFTFNIEEIEKQLKAIWEADTGQELDTTGVNLDVLVTLFRSNYRERDNEITVYRDGKPKLYQVETELYRAIKGLNREASHFIIRALNVPKRIIQAGAVTTIQFVMRNMARDTSTSLIQSETGINPIDIAKGYVSAFTKDKWFRQWVLSGGSTEYIYTNERTQVQGVLDEVLGYTLIDKLQDVIKKPAKENMKRLLFAPINAIRNAMEWSEAGPRVAEFRKAIEKGYGQEVAASFSRDLSQDFARHGYYGKELNKVTAFFNANIQGIEKQIRTFKEHPYRTLLRGLLYVTLPTMLLYFWNDDNEEYKRMAAWRKALFYNIPLGNRKTAQHFLSIPKPYGWGFLFGALPEIILDGIKKDDPKMWKDIRETFATNYDVPIVPSALSPTFEVAMNKSWNKTPIESYGDRFKPPYLRKNENSSTMSVEIANALKSVPGVNRLSPKQLDYLVKGYTGSVGDFFWRLPDTIKKGVELPTDYTNYPVIKSFITDTVYSNRTIDDFYTYGEELNERLTEVKETGTYKAISHLSQNAQKVLVAATKNVAKEYNSLADDFSEARKKIRGIKENDRYNPAEKKLREREIQIRMANKADKFIKKYEAFKKNNNIK